MYHLNICTFNGLQNLPIYVAKQQGYFVQQGLEIEIAYTTGSLPQVAGLVRGEYQLIQTAPDNIMNVNNNPAAFGLGSTLASKVIMLLGGSVGPLSIFAQTGITTFDHLRGSILGVDNPTSGFALVLQDILARNGLLLQRDYTYTIAGGTSNRLHTLKNGSIAATILYSPFDVQATQGGLHKLATSIDYYPAYASLATAATQTWIEQHAREVTSYTSAYLHALQWIYNPTNASEVQTIIQTEPSLGLDASLAAHAYAAFIDPKTGFGETAKVDDSGLKQVIELRARYGKLTSGRDN